MKKGILFDMDGVLLDSEVFICQAAIAYFSERGVTVTSEDFIPFVGAGENRYLGGVAELHGIPIEDIGKAKNRTYTIYEEIVRGKLTPLPGVECFVKECRRRGLKTAVATSADKIKMDINLREIGLDHGEFDALINGLDVDRKKPYPDIYQLAASIIALDPHECIVFEDAPNGVEAAKAAGATCIAITSSFSEQILMKAGADKVIDGFEQIMDFSFLGC